MSRIFIYRFWQEEQGVAALEFSLVAVPLFTLIITTIELGLFYFNAALLEGSVRDAARLIRTGQTVEAADPETLFRETMCGELVLLNCSDIILDVHPFESFSQAILSEPVYDEEGVLVSQGFDVGYSEDVIVARASYQYSFLTPLGSSLLAGGGDRHVNMSSVAIFMNEPFDFQAEGN